MELGNLLALAYCLAAGALGMRERIALPLFLLASGVQQYFVNTGNVMSDAWWDNIWAPREAAVLALCAVAVAFAVRDVLAGCRTEYQRRTALLGCMALACGMAYAVWHLGRPSMWNFQAAREAFWIAATSALLPVLLFSWARSLRRIPGQWMQACVFTGACMAHSFIGPLRQHWFEVRDLSRCLLLLCCCAWILIAALVPQDDWRSPASRSASNPPRSSPSRG